MRCARRPSQTGETGAGRRLVRAAAMAVALAVGAMSSQLTPSWCQHRADTNAGFDDRQLGDFRGHRPRPTSAATSWSGSATSATDGANRLARTNPGGGGALAERRQHPEFRAWGEAYGITARTEAQGDFAGDQRKTSGGVAGIGATLAPGVNVGFSVDQSRSAIDIPLAFQSATLDMTQLGASFSIDKGPWTVAGAYRPWLWPDRLKARHRRRLLPTSNYNATIDGVLGEIDYYWMQNQSRIVPKVAFEYVRSSTDGFTETGQIFFLVTATGATAERARVLIGAEVGHYWIFDRKIFDLSAYGKFVDNVHQNFGAVTVSIPGFQSVSVTGSARAATAPTSAQPLRSASPTGFVSTRATTASFAHRSQSHQGVAGLEVKW